MGGKRRETQAGAAGRVWWEGQACDILCSHISPSRPPQEKPNAGAAAAVLSNIAAVARLLGRTRAAADMASVGAAWRAVGLRPEVMSPRRQEWGGGSSGSGPLTGDAPGEGAAALVRASAAAAAVNAAVDDGGGGGGADSGASGGGVPPVAGAPAAGSSLSRPPAPLLRGTSFVRADVPVSDAYSALPDEA